MNFFAFSISMLNVMFLGCISMLPQHRLLSFFVAVVSLCEYDKDSSVFRSYMVLKIPCNLLFLLID